MCIKDWCKKKNVADAPKGVGICWAGCEDKKIKRMKPPNKIMTELLQGVIMFNCHACKRYWSFNELNTHRTEDRCVMDPNSENLIEKLATRQPKNIVGKI